ncbi:hypothetical protein MML48_4g00011825 [Holotrichia oblita]|uniref:Uncharacterized protein n=1 Tax=Holotrichia oblita TaxID=644536 RepID=A0ACB9T848_HOLOL|nr:hypothetical protein MML48_4g00011825 [Holotrichia oblita]
MPLSPGDIQDSPLLEEDMQMNEFDDSDKDPDYIPESDESSNDENVDNSKTVANIVEVKQLAKEGNIKETPKEYQEHTPDYLGELKQNGEKRKGNKKKISACFVKSMSLSPKNKARRKLLSDIRKKGNFFNSSNIQKPIRHSEVNTKILPCTNCKGYFSSKQLWRHRTKCIGKSDKSHQSKAQDFLLRNIEVDKKLRDEVFPRMRPDEISLIAKSDTLICAYGARYFKSDREKHFINVTSRKMRELSRLLIEIKKVDPKIKNLFQALRPDNFELLISATKVVANYNPETEFYESASTALNLGTAIKQCCEIAILFVLKRKKVYSTIPAAEAKADLKTLINLIDSEWRFEISTQASNDLSMKKWNKVTMVPLASDLKLMKDYLIVKANDVVEHLNINCQDKDAYMILLETVFCRVLLLNRRRPGELQRLPLHIYQNSEQTTHNYEEFADIITLSEQVIGKYAKLCGAKNPHAITATKLRKHLATLTQVLNMSDNDIEQLSTFMGHTVNVHRGSYRLPDDVFQTAKISKLLLLMEKGEAAQYKGKKLDEINLDMNVEFDLSDSDSDEAEPLSNNSKIASDSPLPGTSYDFQVNTPSSIDSVKPLSRNERTVREMLSGQGNRLPWILRISA